MRGVAGGDPGSRSALQRIVHKPQTVRNEHEVFLNWASDSIANSVATSSQILQTFGEVPKACDPMAPQRGGTSPRAPPSPARSPGRTARGASPGRALARSVSPSMAYSGPNGTMSAGMVLSETTAQEANLGRARSARDLFAALSDGTTALAEYSTNGTTAAADSDSRVVSVREFQRGLSVVKPAQPLAFPGPDKLSPGERKRAQAAARAAGREKIPPMGARGLPSPTLADGVTTMLTGVRTDLGEIITAPASAFSSFDNLLDRLVDTPEACFVNPASHPWNPVVIAGRAASPGAHRNVRGGFSFRT